MLPNPQYNQCQHLNSAYNQLIQKSQWYSLLATLVVVANKMAVKIHARMILNTE